MKELYEMARIKKEMRNKKSEGSVSEYDLATIYSLRGLNMISDDEGDFLIAHLAG